MRRRHCLGLLAATALLGAGASPAAPIDLLEQDLTLERGRAKTYVSLAGPGRPAAEVLRAQLQGRLPPALIEPNEQILQALQRVDPVREIAQLAMPVAVVQGTTDIQVVVDDARRLAAARPGSAPHLIEGMNHVLKAVPAEVARQKASYSDPDLPLAPGLITPLAVFLMGVV